MSNPLPCHPSNLGHKLVIATGFKHEATHHATQIGRRQSVKESINDRLCNDEIALVKDGSQDGPLFGQPPAVGETMIFQESLQSAEARNDGALALVDLVEDLRTIRFHLDEILGRPQSLFVSGIVILDGHPDQLVFTDFSRRCTIVQEV